STAPASRMPAAPPAASSRRSASWCGRTRHAPSPRAERTRMTGAILRRVAALALVALALGTASAREIIDSAGRKVQVPDRIARVMAAGPPASVLLYMLAPEKMIGWGMEPRGAGLPHLLPAGAGLPAHR